MDSSESADLERADTATEPSKEPATVTSSEEPKKDLYCYQLTTAEDGNGENTVSSTSAGIDAPTYEASPSATEDLGSRALSAENRRSIDPQESKSQANFGGTGAEGHDSGINSTMPPEFSISENEQLEQNHAIFAENEPSQNAPAFNEEQPLRESGQEEAPNDANEPKIEQQASLLCQTGSSNEDVTLAEPISVRALQTDCDENGSAIDRSEYQEAPLDDYSETDDISKRYSLKPDAHAHDELEAHTTTGEIKCTAQGAVTETNIGQESELVSHPAIPQGEWPSENQFQTTQDQYRVRLVNAETVTIQADPTTDLILSEAANNESAFDKDPSFRVLNAPPSSEDEVITIDKNHDSLLLFTLPKQLAKPGYEKTQLISEDSVLLFDVKRDKTTDSPAPTEENGQSDVTSAIFRYPNHAGLISSDKPFDYGRSGETPEGIFVGNETTINGKAGIENDSSDTDKRADYDAADGGGSKPGQLSLTIDQNDGGPAEHTHPDDNGAPRATQATNPDPTFCPDQNDRLALSPLSRGLAYSSSSAQRLLLSGDLPAYQASDGKQSDVDPLAPSEKSAEAFADATIGDEPADQQSSIAEPGTAEEVKRDLAEEPGTANQEAVSDVAIQEMTNEAAQLEHEKMDEGGQNGDTRSLIVSTSSSGHEISVSANEIPQEFVMNELESDEDKLADSTEAAGSPQKVQTPADDGEPGRGDQGKTSADKNNGTGEESAAISETTADQDTLENVSLFKEAEVEASDVTQELQSPKYGDSLDDSEQSPQQNSHPGANLDHDVQNKTTDIRREDALVPLGKHSDDLQARVFNVFKMFDHTGSNSINVSDVGNALRCLNLNPTEADIAACVQQLSSGGDYVEWNAFSDLACEILKSGRYAPVPEEEMIAAFAVFDEDSSGLISVEELSFILTGFGEPLSEEEVAIFFAFVEKSTEDGFVNYSRSVKGLYPIEKRE